MIVGKRSVASRIVRFWIVHAVFGSMKRRGDLETRMYRFFSLVYPNHGERMLAAIGRGGESEAQVQTRKSRSMSGEVNFNFSSKLFVFTMVKASFAPLTYHDSRLIFRLPSIHLQLHLHSFPITGSSPSPPSTILSSNPLHQRPKPSLAMHLRLLQDPATSHEPRSPELPYTGLLRQTPAEPAGTGLQKTRSTE